MRLLLCILLAICTSASAREASAQLYRWTDEHGQTQYSHALPPPGTFRDLQVHEGAEALTAHERRTLEIIAQDARAADVPIEPMSSRTASAVGSSETAEPSLLARIARAQRSAAGENVRDPCLLSWDPQCYAKNARDYDPRFGYAPSILRSGNGSAVATLR